ncbi:MAG TPA: hypothetical protein VJS69_01275 [Candidatus Krumholzibacteria bacterium]|nr:hypothetical protein [Candidatus Krumholzibacteria bacterium]
MVDSTLSARGFGIVALYTFTDAVRVLARMGVTLRKKDGEFRVTLKGAGEASAYYTNDLADAVQTGQRMLHDAWRQKYGTCLACDHVTDNCTCSGAQ